MTVPVIDPFGVTSDPELPSLALALDPAQVWKRLNRRVPGLTGEGGRADLRRIRVIRYKPGRRCVIEYDTEVTRPGRPLEAITLIGKVRRNRYGVSGYELLKAFWQAGFNADAPDGISVPEPIGTIARFRMWLQRKVPGQVATELLPARGGPALARRIVDAADKVHRSGVPTDRSHTMIEELDILDTCLPHVAQMESRLAGRIDRLLDACHRLGDATPETPRLGIHRDFYADQVIVHGERLYLIDFDEYCVGDPALDIGNFVGAVTEQSVRTLGDPEALVDVERAAEQRFVEIRGERYRPVVRAYALLTLARQVYVSARIPERRAWIGRLLELCEERFGIVDQSRVGLSQPVRL